MAYETVGIDVSHWEPTLVTSKLKGLDFLIARMGTQWNNIEPKMWLDSTFHSALQVAYDLDIPCGAYWYDDYTWFLDNGWTWDAILNVTPENDPRIVTIRRALFSGTSMRKINFLIVDVEQETRNGVIFKEPNWASKSAQSLVDNLKYMMNHNELPQMPIFVYTRASYVNEFCKPLITWTDNYYTNWGNDEFGVWIADWRYNQSKNKTYLASELLPTLPLETSKPAMFGSTTWVLWQYGGDIGNKVFLDGVFDERLIPLAVDVNTTSMNKDNFYKLVKYVPRGSTPEEPPVEDTDLTELNNRVTRIENYLETLPEFVK